MRFLRRILYSAIAILALLIAPPALAFNTYLQSFNSVHGTQGTQLDTCGVCHFDFNGGGPRTPYGEDFLNFNYDASAIINLDSDGDGSSNGQEIDLNTLTLPGLNCTNYLNAQNAPANLVDFVDPARPGCPSQGLPPVAQINGPYYVVNGSPLNLSSAGSNDPDGSIVSYAWNFGNGHGTSTEANPVVTYNIPFETMVLISLTVTDNSGNTDTATTTVVVLQAPNTPPIADAGATVSGSANIPLQFDGSASLDPDGDRIFYSWDFGDGSSAAVVRPSHSYARCGNYDVTLTVSDIHSLIGTSTTSATISGSGLDAPVADAGGGSGHAYNGTVGSNVSFDGSNSSDVDCNIVNYSWDFGDGSNGLGSNPSHAYSAAGNYVVTLTVTDTDGLTASQTATVTIVDAGPLDGALLYESNCAACHGSGTASTKAGADITRINNGIATVPAMGGFSTSLSSQQLQAIADYLVGLSPPPPPVTGADLYATYCATCHGSGSSSTKVGATVVRINTGLTTVSAMASLATTLTTADIQAISDYLVGLTPTPGPLPTDGATLYDSYCAGCHGVGSNSAKAGATVTRIDTALSSVSAMASLATTLTAADVQAIADYLATVSVPTTPQGVYNTYCASCHGADGSGGSSGQDVRGSSVNKISSAISGVSQMNYLSTVSSGNLQLISDFLNGVTTAPPPGSGGGTGADLYASYCAACHGPGNSSSKAGADVGRITMALANVSAMGSLATTLSSADIQAIAAYLGAAAPPSTPKGQYLAYCASCHGADARGGTSGEDIRGVSARKISRAIQDKRAMRSLSTLDSAVIQSIADFLQGSNQTSRRFRRNDD